MVATPGKCRLAIVKELTFAVEAQVGRTGGRSVARLGKVCGLAAARPVSVIQSTGPKIVRWAHPVATTRRNASPAATGCLSFVMESPPQDAGLSDALGSIGPNQWGEVTAALTVARCAAGSRKSDETEYGGGGDGGGQGR
jgi:hypothetical protein